MWNQSLVQQFSAEVASQCEGIDPDSELDWFSLTYGWALAKGLEPTEARGFATHIRYNTELG